MIKLFCFAAWYGVIFIRMGSYQDGIFKFTMNIPENFPDGDCPVSKIESVCDRWVQRIYLFTSFGK